ncbi:MAG TPA: hypothetical protein VFZ61_24045, partial [Polyangiales bacterium]
GKGDPLPARAVTFELLWVAPLSPCHGVVQSPTARKASVDYGDVVLWDGAPVSVQQQEGRPVPVFPLLWILRPGSEKRLRFVGMQKRPNSVQELGEQLGARASLWVIDRRTAPARDGEIPAGSELFYGKLIVPADTPLAELRTALEREIHARPGLTLAIPQLYELLGDTPAAGKAHQAWGGIERAAEKLGLLSARAR